MFTVKTSLDFFKDCKKQKFATTNDTAGITQSGPSPAQMP